MAKPIRIQFGCGSKLIVECIICDSAEASRTVDAYFRAKYSVGKPMGGAIRQLAELPRYWDVPVGSELPKDVK